MSPSHDIDRTPRVAWAGVGLVLGAGLGTVFGLVVAGADGIALGAAVGAAVGLLLGAVADLWVTRAAGGGGAVSPSGGRSKGDR